MPENTNAVTRKSAKPLSLDATDRKLLGLLSQDASASYAELGRFLNLSAPAVHERVKRLRQEGCITRTAAILDGEKIGRPLLTFIHVNTASFDTTKALVELKNIPDVEEIHTITGDSTLLLKIRSRDSHALETLIGHIHRIPGVTNTRSHVALTTYLDRGPSAEL